VSEVAPGSPDEAVLELVAREDRIFLTEDKDFGQLVFAAGRGTRGVIFVRFPASARPSLPESVRDLVATRGAQLAARFVVVEPGRVRISEAPGVYCKPEEGPHRVRPRAPGGGGLHGPGDSLARLV
jgi:hypothetical protein